MANLGSDIVPHLVEPRVEHSIDSLGREMRVSTLGDREGVCLEIRAVEKFRSVERNTVVVGSLFPVRDNVRGDSGGS